MGGSRQEKALEALPGGRPRIKKRLVMPFHEPVMTRDVLAFLAPEKGGVFVDCTVGLGGHARAMLEAGASRMIGLDRDRAALALAAQTLSTFRDRVELVHSDYRAIESVLDERGIQTIDGALADMGLSSFQLESEGRGFSFQREDPLDMRMDPTTGPTAADLLREASETEIADAIYQFGEERFSRRIARAITLTRDDAPIRTTGQLAAIVRKAVPRRGFTRIDPATRTFQALRIWVNGELEHIDAFLAAVTRRLRTGARLVVLTFHSLEDRIVKHTLRALAQKEDALIRVLTKKPVTPQPDEIERNPRARSAKLRAAERMA
jgi:16S rRNA (cytosine1402-N4)-methyltransferase